jgi:hypothetical protein
LESGVLIDRIGRTNLADAIADHSYHGTRYGVILQCLLDKLIEGVTVGCFDNSR